MLQWSLYLRDTMILDSKPISFPCTDEKFRGEYRGIRQGTCFAHNHYAGLSRLSVTQATDAPLMTASEVWFLRAEAALRGWTDENEENCYRNGVMTSFEQWGVYGVEDYLKSERIASNFCRHL